MREYFPNDTQRAGHSHYRETKHAYVLTIVGQTHTMEELLGLAL